MVNLRPPDMTGLKAEPLPVGFKLTSEPKQIRIKVWQGGKLQKTFYAVLVATFICPTRLHMLYHETGRKLFFLKSLRRHPALWLRRRCWRLVPHGCRNIAKLRHQNSKSIVMLHITLDYTHQRTHLHICIHIYLYTYVYLFIYLLTCSCISTYVICCSFTYLDETKCK